MSPLKEITNLGNPLHPVLFSNVEFKDVSKNVTIGSEVHAFLWTYHLIIQLRVSMNHTAATSGEWQETGPFGTFRNVREVDTASPCCTQEFASQSRKFIVFPLCLNASCLS